MIQRRRVGILRRAGAGALALSLSSTRSLSRRLIQRLGARQTFPLVDHRPIQVGYGSGTRSLVWRVARQPAMAGALSHLSRLTQRTPAGSTARSSAFAGESSVSPVPAKEVTESRPFLTSVSDPDVAPVTPRSQGARGPVPARPGRRPMKRTAVELPVQTEASARGQDAHEHGGQDAHEHGGQDAHEHGGQDAHEHVRPEGPRDVAAPLPADHRPDRETLPEPVDTATVVSTEVAMPSPPPPVPPAEALPSDVELTAAPPADAALTEEVGVPTLWTPTEEVSEKPPTPPQGLSRPVPLVSPSPLPAAPGLAARLGRERRTKSESLGRPLTRGRMETPDQPVSRESKAAPLSATTIMRQPLPEGADMDTDLRPAAGEAGLSSHDVVSPVMRRGERKEIRSTSPRPAAGESGLPGHDIVSRSMTRDETEAVRSTSPPSRSRPETSGAPRTEEEAKPSPRRPGSETMPVSSPPTGASVPPVGPRRGTPDRLRATYDYAPTATEGFLRSPRPAGFPSPLISRERLTKGIQAKPVGSSPEGLLDPTMIWSAPTGRELPLAGAADSKTVSLTRVGTGETPEVAGPGRAGVRLETLLADWSNLQDTTPAARTISRQAASGADTGDGEGAETTGTAEAAEAGGEEAIDLDKMARQVYRILHRRLRVEQERARGWVG